MPKPVRITSRTSSITNSFVNGIIPVIWPTEAEIEEALRVLGMDEVVCAYCGGASTEWDHFRPLVVGKKPTGYISEIQNLVPACGKCNQSKGNKEWRAWLHSAARLSPRTRGVADLDIRAARLEDFEQWGSPTRIDFESIVDSELWSRHWRNYSAIVELMREAEVTADAIREAIAASPTVLDAAPPLVSPSLDAYP